MIRQRKAIALKVVGLAAGHHETLLIAAVNLMKATVSVEGLRVQPSTHKMREILRPAYTVLSAVLTTELKGVIVRPEDLHGLELEMSPTHGTYRVSIVLRDSKDPNIHSRYNIRFISPDGKTLQMRALENHRAGAPDLAERLASAEKV